MITIVIIIIISSSSTTTTTTATTTTIMIIITTTTTANHMMIIIIIISIIICEGFFPMNYTMSAAEHAACTEGSLTEDQTFSHTEDHSDAPLVHGESSPALEQQPVGVP